MKITYNGIKYSSKLQACKELGLNYVTIDGKSRKEGWSFERTLDYYTKEHKIVRKQPIIYKGKTYNNLTELARKLNISEKVIYDWCRRRGISSHDGFEDYLNFLKNKGIRYQGKIFNSAKEIADFLKLESKTIFIRCFYKTKDVDKALELYNKGKRKPLYSFVFNGVEYSSLKQLCEAYGVTYKNVTNYALKYNIDRLEVFKKYLEKKGK